MLKNKNILVLTILSCIFFKLHAGTWKVFVYMDSTNELSDMAIKNISDMMHAKPQEKIDFFVQLHSYDLTAYRYKVNKDGLSFIEELTLTGNSKQDFINAAEWAFKENNSDYTMLIAWNHGWGILDPQWNKQTEEWEVEIPQLNNQKIINKRSDIYNLHKNHKGFMFNPHSYLTNQDLIDSLSFIKEKVLNGKKLDILAFDTCMGGMLEIGYQVAPFAHHLIGNQSCSLRDGFNYQGIVAALNQELDPHNLASKMVEAFDNYYNKHDSSGIYTHTALDLEHVQKIKNAFDNVINKLLERSEFDQIIFNAYKESPRFCIFSMYSDLTAFFKNIDKQLSRINQPSPQIISIRRAIEDFYKIIQQFVVRRCGGHTTQDKAHGFSIYLPTKTIDESYYKTRFGCETQWIRFLEHILKNIHD